MGTYRIPTQIEELLDIGKYPYIFCIELQNNNRQWRKILHPISEYSKKSVQSAINTKTIRYSFNI